MSLLSDAAEGEVTLPFVFGCFDRCALADLVAVV